MDRQTLAESLATVRCGGGRRSKTGRSSSRACVLLCERALWPGEANALPPVGRELIGGMDGMGDAWYYYYHAHGVWRRE